MKKRIFKYYFILIFLVLFLSMVFAATLAQNYYKAEVENKLKSIAFSLGYLLEESPTDAGLDYEYLARNYAARHDSTSESSLGKLRITFIDFNGKVLGDSEANFREMENHLYRQEIQEALKGRIGKDMRVSRTVSEDFLYVAVPFKQLNIIVRTSVPLVQINKINDMVWFYALLTFLVALLLSVLISIRISSSITKPLNELILASNEIANGNYTKKIKANNGDELGKLALSFNEMSSRLDLTMTDLHNKKIELESIVGSMTNGLVAVNRNLQIILVNPAARKFFAIDEDIEITGKTITQQIRNNQVNKILKETIELNESLECEVTLGNKTLHIITGPIRSKTSSTTNSGGIVFIQDITKMRKLEQLRTEFVSNVTHELKTPITSIRGFIETLKNGAINNPDVAGRFLDIIDIEAERLYALIEDILQLSEIETRQKDIELEDISLKELIKEVFAVLQPIADEKGISLHYSGVKEGLVIKANKNRMKQLFLNLVDNGIKYNTPQGSVVITAFREKGKIVISVKDTGIGIPAEHSTRIFERFYRVDKGRSRDKGGTGLGLSIVKHIVNLYNGDIKVNSEVDKGTEFIIQLPS